MFNVGELGATINADRTPFDRTLNGVFRTGARRMQRLGSTMTRALTLPLTAFAGASVKAFADFDQAMTESTAIMDGVTNDVRASMEEAARSISQELAISSEQAAESYFFLASAGLDAQQSMQALPQVASFAQAGMFDMATATDLATDAQSALGLTVDDAADNLQNLQRVTDTLVKANTLANASVQQFSEALTNRAAAAMRSANIEIEEGVAVLAAFADQGLKGQRAGEQFSRILRILSQQASKNKELFSDLGIIDSEGNLNNMADVIEALTNELDGLSNTAQSARLEQLGFTARVQAAIKPLLGTADAIREYQRGLERAAGITDEVAENQMQSLTNQFTVLWNTIVNGGQAIGASLNETFDIAGLVRGFQDDIKAAIDTFNALPQETRKMAFQVAGLLGASGPIIAALGTLSLALSAISWPAVLGVTAFAGAATAIVQNWDAVVQYFTSGQGGQIWGSIRDATTSFISGFGRLWSQFGGDIIGTMKTAFSTTIGIIGATFEGMSVLLDVFSGRWITEWDDFLSDTESSWDDTFGEGGYLRDVFLDFTQWLSGGWAVQAGMEIGGFVADGMMSALQGIGLVPEDFPSIATVFDKWGQEREQEEQENKETADQIASIWGGLADKVNSMNFTMPSFSADEDSGSGFSVMGDVFTDVGNTISQVMDRIKEDVSDTSDSTVEDFRVMGDAFTNVGLSVDEMFAGVMNQSSNVSQAAQTIGQSLGQMFDQAILHGQDFLGVLIDIIKQLASRVFVQGIMALITGGKSLVGGSIGEAIFGGLFGGNRANGGPVFAGQAYKVGESGPEMFMSSTNGSIQPMQKGSDVASASAIGQEVSRQITKHMQKLGPSEFYMLSQKGARSY